MCVCVCVCVLCGFVFLGFFFWLSTSFEGVVCFEMVCQSFYILADVLGRNSFITEKADCLPSSVDWRIMLLVTDVRVSSVCVQVFCYLFYSLHAVVVLCT